MRIVSNRLLTRLLLIAAMAACVGCSSFDRDWQAAKKVPPADAASGCWKGGWQSKTNFHKGGLRCIIAKPTLLSGDEIDVRPVHNLYEARFRATYRGVIPFEYVMPMTITENADGSISFTGEADLGPAAGGVYKYEGTIRDDQFIANYDSRYDDGIFFMFKQASK